MGHFFLKLIFISSYKYDVTWYLKVSYFVIFAYINIIILEKLCLSVELISLDVIFFFY